MATILKVLLLEKRAQIPGGVAPRRAGPSPAVARSHTRQRGQSKLGSRCAQSGAAARRQLFRTHASCWMLRGLVASLSGGRIAQKGRAPLAECRRTFRHARRAHEAHPPPADSHDLSQREASRRPALRHPRTADPGPRGGARRQVFRPLAPAATPPARHRRQLGNAPAAEGGSELARLGGKFMSAT